MAAVPERPDAPQSGQSLPSARMGDSGHGHSESHMACGCELWGIRTGPCGSGAADEGAALLRHRLALEFYVHGSGTVREEGGERDQGGEGGGGAISGPKKD
jgi:hypothetical protein